MLVLSALAPPAEAAPLLGMLKLPAKIVHKPRYKAKGFWKFPNNALNTLPPLADARRSMVVVLVGTHAKGIAPVLRMVDARFDPPVLPVKPGDAVSFVNMDRQLHLLDVTSAFNGKRVGPGDKVVHTFPKKGSYTVKCSELPHMIGTVFVTPNVAAVPNGKGEFRFDNVDAGSHTLRVWYRGRYLHTQSITMGKRKTSLEIQLPPITPAAESKE